MAKRRAAEPLTFHVPWKRLLLCDFPEEPPPWVPPSGAAPPGLSRKRKIDPGAMAEPAASPSKRRDGGESSARGGQERPDRGLGTGEPSQSPLPGRSRGLGEELPDARPPRGGGDDEAGHAGAPRGDWGAAPRQHNEEFWQYNTFQYWRNPLPPIDLADIADVSEDSLTVAALQGKSEVVEIDMES
ncbi:uncharacterized protein C9orf40 homolog [Perognathus longimembris pacificus]|uniref:uncharacterized protein C9orf40 homolog n=1 Tax=Perognathus longimembris pacificus TaxID=214514 RepID=UPI002018B8A0|nr:uncharacterized protein C9orf40 homolog [Perognathus longimembris pacificus]